MLQLRDAITRLCACRCHGFMASVFAACEQNDHQAEPPRIYALFRCPGSQWSPAAGFFSMVALLPWIGRRMRISPMLTHRRNKLPLFRDFRSESLSQAGCRSPRTNLQGVAALPHREEMGLRRNAFGKPSPDALPRLRVVQLETLSPARQLRPVGHPSRPRRHSNPAPQSPIRPSRSVRHLRQEAYWGVSRSWPCLHGGLFPCPP